MKRAIGVVVYENLVEVEECLKAIRSAVELAGSTWMVFVVDNSATFNHHLACDPGMTYKHSGENVGFGRACNSIAELALDAGCDTLTLVNPDCVVDVNALCAIEAAPWRDTVVAAQLRSIDGDAAEQLLGVESPLQGFLRLARLSPHRTIKDSAYVSGAFITFDLHAFNLAGGFDPAFFLYYEEADLVRRLRVQQANRIVLTSAGAIHLGSLGWRSKSPKAQAHFLVSRVVYMTKHEGGASALSAVLFNMVELGIRMAGGVPSRRHVGTVTRLYVRFGVERLAGRVRSRWKS